MHMCLFHSPELATRVCNVQVRREVDLMRSKHNTVPGLAVIMVGERRDSAKYVSMKQVRARKIGGQSTRLPHIDYMCTYASYVFQHVVFLANGDKLEVEKKKKSSCQPKSSVRSFRRYTGKNSSPATSCSSRYWREDNKTLALPYSTGL